MSTTALSRPAVATDTPQRLLTWTSVSAWANRYAVPSAASVLAGLGLLLAAVSLCTNSVDRLAEPMMVALLVSELFVLAHVFYWTREIAPPLVILIGATLVAAALDGGLPDYFAALGQSAIFHRSIVSAVLLVMVGLPLLCLSLFHLLGGTPTAEDVARYPLVVAPALALLALYGALVGVIVVNGAPQLSWDIVTHPMDQASIALQLQPGFANHILGTLLLIVLTAMISVPIGTATGIYLNEYAPPPVASVVRFCTTALRGVSVLLIGLTAVTLLQLARDTPLISLLEGSFIDRSGVARTLGGSFLLASVVISLLVIPVVARAAEEGCRSLPAGLREGSAALGASDAHVLWRIIVPWAMPNIITSILLGSAEAAGSLAPLIFIAGPGDAGVGPLRPVTSLSYVVFDAVYSMWASFRNAIEPHRFGGALLLLVIAFVLTAAGLLLKHRYASRYRS